jgi:hypothetical protein
MKSYPSSPGIPSLNQNNIVFLPLEKERFPPIPFLCLIVFPFMFRTTQVCLQLSDKELGSMRNDVNLKKSSPQRFPGGISCNVSAHLSKSLNNVLFLVFFLFG